jgi:hypothetical protein
VGRRSTGDSMQREAEGTCTRPWWMPQTQCTRQAGTLSGQADGHNVRGADPMDLDVITQVRWRSCTEGGCVWSSHLGGREVRAVGDEVYVEVSTGDSMQLTRTRVHVLRMKKETKRAARADHTSAADLCAIQGTWPCAQGQGSKSRGRTPCV